MNTAKRRRDLEHFFFAEGALSIKLAATRYFIYLPKSSVSSHTSVTDPYKRDEILVLCMCHIIIISVLTDFVGIYPFSIEIGYYGAKELVFSLPRQLALI